ncbi:tyrosine-type recombinase/integrase [Microcoleus sp. B3-A4]
MTRLGDRPGLRWRSSDECRVSSFNPAASPESPALWGWQKSHWTWHLASKEWKGWLITRSVQEKWVGYCAKAGISCTIHEHRHAHATELVNEGVSLNTIRKRLGYPGRNIRKNTSLLAAMLSSWSEEISMVRQVNFKKP